MDTMESGGPALRNSRLQRFFIDEIKDIYWAEKHLVKVLPNMKDAAHATELRHAFDEHLEVTRGHVTRLEQVFSLLNEEPEGQKCDAMKGITDEGRDIIDDTDADTATRDAGLILAAQKVEHYEIATYGSLIKFATVLGHNQIAQILSETLAEEKQADQSLTELAEAGINREAAVEQFENN